MTVQLKVEKKNLTEHTEQQGKQPPRSHNLERPQNSFKTLPQ
jgi:hypothetical protein